MQVAVLGLGRMGEAIAERLLEADHQVRVWNRTEGRAAHLHERGATECADVSEAVSDADAVVVSLSADDAVRSVLLPDGAPLPDLKGVVIDCSTVAPGTSTELARAYAGRFVACPIAGAPPAVRSGAATLIVGGSTSAQDAAATVLNAVSSKQIDAGADAASAAVLKLLNNYLLLTGLAALADAVSVGRAAGVSEEVLSGVLTTLPVVAPGLHNRVASLLGEDHEPWFSLDLGAKDLRLFAELAEQSTARVALTPGVRAAYQAATDLGVGQRDLTAVIEPLKRKP